MHLTYWDIKKKKFDVSYFVRFTPVSFLIVFSKGSPQEFKMILESQRKTLFANIIIGVVKDYVHSMVQSKLHQNLIGKILLHNGYEGFVLCLVLVAFTIDMIFNSW